MTETSTAELDFGSEDARALWRKLATSAGYFSSEGFLDAWLDALPIAVRPRLVAIVRQDRPVALFLSGARKVVRHGFLPSRVRYLNTSGDPRYDEITLEHNAVLVEPRTELGLGDLLAAHGDDWDEIELPALDKHRFPGSALTERLASARVQLLREVESPYVDLSRARAAPGGYLGLLSSGTRAQIRRAERGWGDVRLELARETSQALDVLSELVELHQRHWGALGQPGAFADPWFLGFHRALVEQRFSHGEVQLVRVASAKGTIGCLYNFVWQGRVSFYQGGLASSDDPRLKPGYVCHARVVELCAALGCSVYDFMGGGSRYKRSLATDAETLVWARVQRPLLRFDLEQRLRALRTAWLARQAPPVVDVTRE